MKCPSDLSTEAVAQLHLRYQLAQEVAKRYFEAGFTVVYQDIIIGETLATMAEAFRDYPLAIIVLCPDAETIAARELRGATKPATQVGMRSTSSTEFSTRRRRILDTGWTTRT